MRLHSLIVCLAAGLLLAMPADARAQHITAAAGAIEPAFADKQGKELHALRLGGSPPKIDGHLDDEVWKLAQTIDDFVQVDPDNMTAPTERTTLSTPPSTDMPAGLRTSALVWP